MNHGFKLLILSVFILACSGKPEGYLVQKTGITESVYASGKIKSKNQYQTVPRVNGILKSVLVKEGDPVKKGQLLFVITNDQASLQREGADIAYQRASLENNREKLDELRFAMDQARLKKVIDSNMLVRQQSLWSQNIGSRAELETRQLAYESSLANLRSLQERHADLLKNLAFQEKQARTNLKISGSNLSDFEVRSEVDGKVYRVFRDPGELVGPNTPLAVVGDAGHFLALLQVDERDINQVKKDQKVYIEMESYSGQVFEARVQKISPFLNEKDRSIEVEAVFDRTPDQLFPNLSFEANIVISQKNDALAIPLKYLTEDSHVYTGPKERVSVSTGIRDFEKVEITSGLQEGMTIYLPEL